MEFKSQWTAKDFADFTGLRVRSIRYHRQQLCSRNSKIPFPKEFPLSQAEALRFTMYLFHRPIGRGRKRNPVKDEKR